MTDLAIDVKTLIFAKYIFCFAAGLLAGWYVFRTPGPWGYFVSTLRFLLFAGVVTFTLGVLLFPVYDFIKLQVLKPPLMLKSNKDLQHHTIRTYEDGEVSGYLEHLPPGYEEHPDKIYPMIVFLHGLAEYGNGVDEIYRAAELGVPREVEIDGDLCVTIDGIEECFIVITPQKNNKKQWDADVQRDFWNYILHGPENYRYDPDRIFLSGLSLGAHGVWEWAHSDEPDADYLAGIVAVSGRGDMPVLACRLEKRGINVWSFHGAEDTILPPEKAMQEFYALERCEEVTGAVHKWTNVPNAGHWMYDEVYLNDHHLLDTNIYEWMATHPKKYPPVRPEPLINGQ